MSLSSFTHQRQALAIRLTCACSLAPTPAAAVLLLVVLGKDTSVQKTTPVAAEHSLPVCLFVWIHSADHHQQEHRIEFQFPPFHIITTTTIITIIIINTRNINISQCTGRTASCSTVCVQCPSS